MNAIEGGKYSASLEVAFKIARTLDVPLEHVFDYPDEREPQELWCTQSGSAGRSLIHPAPHFPADPSQNTR